MKRLSLPYYYSRSGAKFESTDRFLESSIVVDTNTEKLKRAGIPIAQIDHDTYATTKEEMHCFVIGETGCGKTRRVILPTIRLLAKTGESMVISDPKGELYRHTADILRKKGYNVKVLNFRKPRCGNRWNPLALIEKLYRSPSAEDRDKATMMLDDLVAILSGDMSNAEDPYWAIAAAMFFRGVAQIILEYGKVGELTFESIALTAKKIHKAYDTKAFAADKYIKATKAFIASLPRDSTIVQNLGVVIVNADSTRNCIMSMFDSMISQYVNQELMLDLFSKSEIDIDSIGKEPTALFFILPDDSNAMYPIATYFVKQVYSTLISLADEQPNGELPNKVTFLLDEFANFAKLPAMHAMLTAARSRKIRFVLVCQSMDQLIEKYTEPGMEILLSNCRVWLYMSCRNLPFLRRLEELSGKYTSPYTNESCPLVDISTLQHFSMGQVLVFNDRCRPLIGYLNDYSAYDFGSEGSGKVIDIPAPHALTARDCFDFDALCEKHIKRENSEEW
ncbi:MAG: type IV secretory system conjugative DNA transfer family protein [Clostridia bacterium]|nr:type IV secretory system conjugative DNA transfer family protein [Clostridia bacterium]